MVVKAVPRTGGAGVGLKRRKRGDNLVKGDAIVLRGGGSRGGSRGGS